MYCYECGGNYQKKYDLLEVTDPYIGIIAIQGVEYYQCSQCASVLYTEEMSRAIESERNRLIQGFLNSLPVGDFISAADTAAILAITRQALHKNRRINHGFIFQTKISGTTFYLRRSAVQFKETGDGRFLLYPHGYISSERYIEDTVPLKYDQVYNYYSQGTPQSQRTLFRKSTVSILEENCYAN